MTNRPEILFKLFADLETLDGIGPKSAKLLPNLGIERPKDMVFHLPNAVIDRRLKSSTAACHPPDVVTVEIVVGAHVPASGRGRPYRVMVRDADAEFQLVFFNARDKWIRDTLPTGQSRIVSGKVELYDGMIQMVHPDHILAPDAAETLPAFEPVYPLTAGVTLKAMRRAAASALAMAPDLEEWIDPLLLAEREWPSWNAAIEAAHAPAAGADISALAPARARLAYDEFLAHQITLALARMQERKRSGVVSQGDGTLREMVLAALPFAPTGAQTRAIAEITADMAAPARMNRLLQGDVGSGKTLVAVMAALAAIEAGGQAALMAPTEILARQHIEAIRPLLEGTGIGVELLTGRDKGGRRKDKLARLENGDTTLLIGTHALFQKDVVFRDLRLAIIDEQHRFGVRERMELGDKGRAADVLVMTATPIPRSLELTHYGDMDLSVLDEKPPGRKPIETVLIDSNRLEQVVSRMKSAIAEGRQAYWVCPLVAESEVLEATAAEARFKALRAALGDDVVSLVHGQMPPRDKDAAMADFVAGKTRLLVATTVIEVGVDVPNASIMVIEGAEKFGLAQLHQLRGRVGRGAAASTCLLLYDAPLGETARARLGIMRETEDGFRIAEEDLRLRGAGDVLGVAQSGLPRFRIADPETQTGLLKTAQKDARNLLADDPDLATPRGQAARALLYLMDRDAAFRLMSVG